jgi:phosphatidylserine/phosphatidylglycerophosphate/cardiolipin synthase-like enzyme
VRWDPHDVLGFGIEALITSHHRRRLNRSGNGRALQATEGWWASGDPRPRSGNSVRVLTDGQLALREIAQAIRSARTGVCLTGWHLTPGFALTHEEDPTILKTLLAETAARCPVRVLLWGGSPAPLFQPDRKGARQIKAELSAGTRIMCALDTRERPLHCHHEKTVIVDDHLAFVGGIDLTSFGGDRWDTKEHQLRQGIGWHDHAVRLEGPVVSDLKAHFAMRWQAITGEALAQPPAAEPAGSIDVQLVRTVPGRMYRQCWNGDYRILEAYLGALRSARRFIYLENQFLWSPEILAVLRDRLLHPPTPDFRLVLLLPEKPNNGGDDTRGQLGTLVQADAGAGRILACTIYQRGTPRERVYVHAKLGIVDDCWMTIGSANLNEHSLFNDTEVNVVVTDQALIRATREQVWAEHLEREAADVAGDPVAVIDGQWKPIAQEQAERRKQGQPPTHHLSVLPGISRRSGLLKGPLQGLLVDA